MKGHIMPMLRERILELLQDRPGLTDREITDELFASGSAQRPVNQACRALELQRCLSRRHRSERKIGNYLETVSARGVHQPTSRVVDDENALSEDEVKQHLKIWLESRGWETHVVWGKERGTDIDASKQGQRWIIEVKGSGSLDPMRVNYFLAILGEILQRMNEPDAKYSIGLPGLNQFRRLWKHLPRLARSRTTVTALFVDKHGNVEEVN